jgi:membrane protease YdiL (CAAX protease family)
MSGQTSAAAGVRQPGGLFRGPPAYATRTPWSPIQALAAVAVILLSSMALHWLLVDLVGSRWGQPIVTAQWGDVLSRILVLFLTLGAATLLGGSAREVLALRRPARGWRSYAGAALLSIVVPLVLALALFMAIVLLGLDQWLLQSIQQDHRSARAWDGDWPLAVIVAPLEEELMFRGFLLSALAQTRLGFWGAALVSTALWTALHEYSVLGLAKVFALGLLFSWLLWRTGSLRVTVFCHALNNVLALAVLQLVDFSA